MVKIINGEIVQDNDPRVIEMNKRAKSNFGETQRRWGGQVKGVHCPADTVPSGTSSKPSNRASTQAETVGNPLLLQIEHALGIQGKIITIPAVDILSFSPTQIPLLYIIFLGLAVVFFGINALLLATAGYAYIKYTENQRR